MALQFWRRTDSNSLFLINDENRRMFWGQKSSTKSRNVLASGIISYAWDDDCKTQLSHVTKFPPDSECAQNAKVPVAEVPKAAILFGAAIRRAVSCH